MLLEFEVEVKAKAMSSVSSFLISFFAAIHGLGLLPSVFRLGFGFFFFFLENSWPVGLLSFVGLAICCFFFFQIGFAFSSVV